MNPMTKCDMCGFPIINGLCSCGKWFDKNDLPPFHAAMGRSLEEFNDLKKYTATGDAPHLGCAVVFFRGSYTDCQKVEKFIHDLHGRPFYDG